MKNLIYLVAIVLTATVGCKKSDEQANPNGITCTRNLCQIYADMRNWEIDHHDKPPYLLSTNEGGVMELVTEKDGMRQNPHLIFQVMSNELVNPLLLVCPQDSKTAAKDWQHLTDANVSYVFPTHSMSNVIMQCPVDGTVMLDDGTVWEKSGRHSMKF